ncbi:MAG: hypothetical protein J1E34_08265 [Oscillospiraceae bacterium]|nr:hypothetical protein [Oscillospiraceae bacterium]
MIKKILRPLIIALFVSCVLLFAGCIKFENSFDLTVSSQPGSSPSETEQPEPSFTEAPSSEENSSSDTETETKEPPTQNTEPSSSTEEPSESETQGISAPKNSEYDILKTGEFGFVGTIINDNEEMDINISAASNKIYFTSEIDGLQIGLYVEGKKTYIYAPEHKKYLKMNSVVAKMLQLDPDDFVEMANGFGFDKLPDLSLASSVENSSLNGVSCEKYSFLSEDPNLCVYMNGQKLLKIGYIDKSGKETYSISFSSVSAGFPKMPPDGFEEMSYLEFFKLVAGDL